MIETICKDCGQRYRPGTDHVCPVAKKPKKASKQERPQDKKRARDASDSDLAADLSSAPTVAPAVEGSNPSGAAKFDKKAWMRGYMRDYRAKHPRGKK